MKPFEKNYPAGVYIHWPFCTSRCSYCDFIALEKHEGFQEQYHRALCREVSSFFADLPAGQDQVKTIYMGGGTPSLYPPKLLEELFECLYSKITLAPNPEITIEANPADITLQKLTHWKYLGINRLSLGVQCLDDEVLKKLNRRQMTSDALRAIELASSVFDNISVDIILGLPGLDETGWFGRTLEPIMSWPIQHVSLYFLTIYEKTPLYFKVAKHEVSLLDDDTLVDWYQRSVDILQDHGFEQYEISNFARQGFLSRHNKAYWDRKPYKAFGLGASSYDGSMRLTNTPNLMEYLASEAQARCSVPFSYEILTEKQMALEELMLGLRQTSGVDLQRVVYFLKSDEKEKIMHTISSLQTAGFLHRDENRIRLTRKGMVLENEIVTKLSVFGS